MDFPINFPQYEKRKKPIVRGESGKLVLILFPQYGCSFPIRFPSYDKLYDMGNAWVSISISHSRGKCNKTHRMRRTWEIGTHTFPIVWVLFSHFVASHGILHHTRNVWVSPSISHSTEKYNKTHRMRRTQEIGTHTFPIVWVLSFHQISSLWYTS